MEIKDLLNSEANITVAIRLEDLRQWHSELVSAHMAERENVEQDDLLTPDEVCKRLKCSRSTLSRYQKKGYLVPVHVGGKVLFKDSDIKAITKNG